LKETEPVHEILEKKVAQQTKPALNKAQKLIVSITSGILGILLISAFLSQSTSFPETSFELFLLLAVAVLIYGIILWWTWRSR
jgi:ABC-type nickel/cobalt efflux system permease component RcnA